MSKREKLPELRSTGNWVGAPKKKETAKKKPVGQGAKPKAKPAKPKRMGEGAKPRNKPDQAVKKAASKDKSPAKNSGASRSTSGKSAPKSAQNRSGDAVLGMGPKDAAAKKINRQPGFGGKSDKYTKRKQARTGRK